MFNRHPVPEHVSEYGGGLDTGSRDLIKGVLAHTSF